MIDKQIALPLTADLALDEAVRHWNALEREPLLDVGDTLNEINNRSQLALGAWLTVYEDVLGYGAIKDMAERWDRKPNTLSQWKRVYLRTRNVEHAKDLPFGKMQELARIPPDHQDDWIESAREMKRDDFRKAISAAKDAHDWTPPVIITSEPPQSPPPKSPDQSSQELIENPNPVTGALDAAPEPKDILSFSVGRLAISVRWEKAARP